MTSYEELPGLGSYVFEESFVLDVAAKPAVVSFRLEVVLTPEHPAYVAPGPDTYLCYRDGRLEFDGVTDLEWTGQGALPATDASGEIDYGHIDTMTWDAGLFELQGDWGTMRIWAKSARVVLD
jgi:hypothetical protein